MAEFKVGDKVRIISSMVEELLGLEGEIRGLNHSDTGMIAVKLEDKLFPVYIFPAGLELIGQEDPAGVAIQRHPLSRRFVELASEMVEMHDLKQRDYGKDNDPFANVRASSEWNMPAWVGAMVRATDKVRRLQTFARKGELANESALDAFMDLAVYALIARILYEEGVNGGE